MKANSFELNMNNASFLFISGQIYHIKVNKINRFN